MSDDVFVFEGMTQELQTYFDHTKGLQAIVDVSYPPYQEAESKWSKGGCPESGPLKEEKDRLSASHYGGIRAHGAVGKTLRGKIQPGLLEKYNLDRLTWMCRDSTANPETLKEVLSPLGRYKLVISYHSTRKGSWGYTKGRTFRVSTGEMVGEVCRNYSSFPYLFVEDHPSSHDYLVCGSDYQGQTVVELDTKSRKDYLPSSARAGFGFCWSSYQASPSKLTLAVEGCFWACPYEVWMVDFSAPMVGLWTLEMTPSEVFLEWVPTEPDTALLGPAEYRYCIPLDKREKDMTEEEMDEMIRREDGGESESQLWRVSVEDTTRWVRPDAVTIASKYIDFLIESWVRTGRKIPDEHILNAGALIDGLEDEEIKLGLLNRLL